MTTGHSHPLPDPLAQSVGFLLSRLGRRFRRGFAAALAPYRIQPSQYGVLAVLEDWGVASQREVGAVLGIDRSNMVALLDDLERRGFIARARDGGDRRRHAVQLTEAGHSLVATLHLLATRYDDGLLAPLDETDRAHLIHLLAKLHGTLQDHGDQPSRPA